MDNSSGGGQNYVGPGKTTVSILNEETGLLMVDSFSVRGFRLNNGMFAFGPIAILPTCVLAWRNVRGPEDISPASLSLFSLLHPRPDVVLVGAGDRGGVDIILGKDRKKSDKMLTRLREMRLNVEVLPTEHAVSTYNYLCTEGRAVGAALLPPDTVRMMGDEDVIKRKLATTEDIFYDKRIFTRDDYAGSIIDYEKKKKGDP